MVRRIEFTPLQRERLESAVRKALRAHEKRPDVKERVRLVMSLAARPGEQEPVDGKGDAVKVEVKGRAFLVRFRHYAPRDVHSARDNDRAEKMTRDGMRDAMDYARDYCGVDVLPCTEDTFDGWYLAVGTPHQLAHWIRYKEHRIAEVADLQSYRVSPIGSGQAGGAALQRKAYKDTLREMRTAKSVKTLAGFARHTADEGDLALLCRCVHCGRDVRTHDDVACTLPTFVADANAVVENGLEPTDNRPSPAERKARRGGTEAQVQQQEQAAAHSARVREARLATD